MHLENLIVEIVIVESVEVILGSSWQTTNFYKREHGLSVNKRASRLELWPEIEP